ncbi:unnamed protein product [Chondrus crispus]|uniref:Uncharacterized protein n=1 Tax=Chondrus crispus TaxID=2769 RepID=R7QJM2_CHOCR|nr:unnamed protein product [Chondrus crispus]CDF37938.1 unnamed protein product [Chondrus crispus]|eukprot:XP_005719434.1 unnamed protein product [Chondrus crispus]
MSSHEFILTLCDSLTPFLLAGVTVLGCQKYSRTAIPMLQFCMLTCDGLRLYVPFQL